MAKIILEEEMAKGPMELRAGRVWLRFPNRRSIVGDLLGLRLWTAETHSRESYQSDRRTLLELLAAAESIESLHEQQLSSGVSLS